MANYRSQSEKREMARRAPGTGVGEPCRTAEPAPDRSARHKVWKRRSARDSASILCRENRLVPASEAANRVNESIPEFIEAAVHRSFAQSAPGAAPEPAPSQHAQPSVAASGSV